VFWTCQFQFSGWLSAGFSAAGCVLFGIGATGSATELVETSAAVNVVAVQASAVVAPAVLK
jgi:hypothetical protein